MPRLRCWIAMLGMVAALVAGGEAGAETTAADGSGPPAQVLLVASDSSSEAADRLAKLLEDRFPVAVTAIDAGAYRPLIDAAVHDGFVYLGENYFVRPPETFLSDMAGTEKPLLWINYHAWLQAPETAERTGIRVRDIHDNTLDRILGSEVTEIGPVDTSLTVVRHPAQVLYWLSPRDMGYAVPGAVTAPGMTYVNYLPSFRPGHPGIPAFLAAAEAALSEIAAEAPPPRSAEERLAAARADPFRSIIHLPFIADERVVETRSYDDDAYHARLLRIRDAGADWVLVSQTFFQDGTDGAQPWAHEQATASLAELEDIVRDAHALGLFVRLSIVVNLTSGSRGPDDWRGMIRPDDAEAWWAVYRQNVLRAARFARRMGVEGLSIGAELSALQEDAAHWRALARDVRKEAGYQGLVSYQVNYNALQNMGWADALDFLSIAAYWPLADTRDPALEELAESWEAIGAELAAWRKAHPGVELEFGEIGYASQPYSALFPFSWRPNRSAHLSLTEQLTCYLALEDFLRDSPGISGIGIFASTAYDGDPRDVGYTPFGKPAEQVVRRLMTMR